MLKKEIDISVIVPMYNVEEFLPRCIDSIINQTHKNIEIILVDDGSPDRSGEIAEEYAEKDERIKVIHQENRWLGGARNSGMRIATGKYVLFVDSDDYIRLDMCELLFNKIEKDNVDLVFFDLYGVDENENIVSTGSLPFEPDRIYKNNDAKEILYPLIISSHSLNSAVMKIYNRDFLIDESQISKDAIRMYQMEKDVKHFTKLAMSDIENKTQCFEGGCDDYLVKPFEPQELILRIKNILKKTKQTNKNCVFGEYTFDFDKQILLKNGEQVYLTDIETKLLNILCKNINIPLTRQDLLIDDLNERSVDVSIARLRKKIEDDTKKSKYLRTIRNTGYILNN